jgi:hypothetical protein
VKVKVESVPELKGSLKEDGMDYDKELTRCLARLKNVIWKIIEDSGEFEEVKKYLERPGVDIELYLIPVFVGLDQGRAKRQTGDGTRTRAGKGRPTGKRRPRRGVQLSEEDRSFLKRYGIRW